MATPAPSPKKAKAARQGKTVADVERRVLRMTHTPTDRTYELDLNELGPGDDRLTRRVCGMPASSYLASEDTLGADGVSVLWWLARQKAGEVCSFSSSEAELGSFKDIQRDLDIVVVTDEDDDLEGGADPT